MDPSEDEAGTSNSRQPKLGKTSHYIPYEELAVHQHISLSPSCWETTEGWSTVPPAETDNMLVEVRGMPKYSLILTSEH